MLLIRPARRTLIEAAISDVRAGRPRLLRIEGASGMGKTTHLRAVLDAARGFRTLEAACDEASYRPAYGVLEKLGVPRTITDKGVPHSPAVAAQSLRRLIDQKSTDGPLVLAIDDAQWADCESLDALRLVLERIAGDRLLVVVAHRPFQDPSSWQRYCDGPGAATVLALEGIDRDEATEIVQHTAPDAGFSGDLIDRLWRHTDRNPLYLASLVQQYTAEDLAESSDLPAPREVARDLNDRLASMDADAGRLLRAIAVVGSSWVDRLDAAAIAGIEDPSSAFALLDDSGLLVARTAVPLADVRIVHALVRAAVYQSTPHAERRGMHAHAATLLVSPMQRLEHAVAAADQRDDRLAARLEQAAAVAHESSDYHREAQLWRWASQLSASVAERERRWLESQLATVLARDTPSVRARLAEIGWAEDVPRRTVVQAWLLIAENRIAEARRALEALRPEAVAGAEPLVRTRLLVLKAWTMLTSGYATPRIQAVLAQVGEQADLDPAVRPLYLRTAGQLAARGFDFDHLQKDFDAVPTEASTTPMRETDRLAWRGAVYALCGFAWEARRDLSEVVSRVRGGHTDAASGVNHALYGFALWLDGEVERAGIELQAAADLASDRLHPLVQAVFPLVPTVRGDFERADALLGESEAVLRDLPWHEAVSVLIQAQIVRLHAGDDEPARRTYLAQLRARFGPDVTSAGNAVGAIWHLHIALARVWAGELDEVEDHLVGIETDMIVPAWSVWCRPWLSGLRSERAGDLDAARVLLADAVAALNPELPLYRGHVHTDFARVSARLGFADAAARSADEARSLYSRLGAAPYLTASDARREAPAPQADPLHPLSDREREVAALLLSGFSYAQIAEELYVTRSTVAFHLGNIYAKTAVQSRHQFIRLARSA